ncbi:MAG: AarF/UbiB family protein, partial [Candidatus Omnitrophica bacterium]|nr:AarF/UbiB family protein [Candidatus Omnitrophota bacterium]
MRKYLGVRKLKRYRQIINILIKYGFGIILQRVHIIKFPKRKKIEISIPERIRKILEELGPTFIKLGQILSTRPDLIPIEYIKELEKLQDNVKEEDFNIMENLIEEEFGKPIEEIFDQFQPIPIASASLSCVYKGKYKGKDVAIKVQRPNVKQQILTDIQILYDIAALIERFIKESEIYQPIKIVREFEKSIKKELNFLIEARNFEIVREKMKDEEKVFVPYVFKELCSEKIIVTEFIEGVKISEVEVWSEYVNKEEILKTGTNIILKQIFDIGVFHGDPHPGNIFILKDGKIAMLDFGIVGYLDEEKKYHLINLFSGLIKGRTEKVIFTLKHMNSIDKSTNVDELKEDIEELFETYKDIPIKRIKIGELIGASFEIMRKNKIKIPISFSLIGKSIITLEGICHFIEPDFKLIESIEPYLIDLLDKKLKFTYFFKKIENTFDRFS